MKERADSLLDMKKRSGAGLAARKRRLDEERRKKEAAEQAAQRNRFEIVEKGARREKQERVRMKRLYRKLEEELAACLEFRDEMGERVRAATGDKPFLDRLVAENRANDARIRSLQIKINDLSRWK